jgi:hypothetical protein
MTCWEYIFHSRAFFVPSGDASCEENIVLGNCDPLPPLLFCVFSPSHKVVCGMHPLLLSNDKKKDGDG